MSGHRIGIDATFTLYGGGRTHLCALLGAWREHANHEFVVFAAPQNLTALQPFAGPRMRILPQVFPESRLGRLLWFHVRFPSTLRRAAADVMLYPGGYLPLGWTPPAVAVFRNAAPFCELLTARSVGWSQWIGFALLGAFMRNSARRARKVIFPSQYLRRVFVDRYGMAPDGGVVIYHGRDTHRPDAAESGAFLERYGITVPFDLYVSHLYRYKNVVQLIDAYGLAQDVMRKRGLSLIIAGGAPDLGHRREIDQLVRARGLEREVRFTGALSPAEVGQAIAACESFVFSSTCENCPNTLIEALALGKPIAASNASAMPEICGDAAVYFDPMDPASISRQLIALAEDAELRERLSAQALRRGQQFPEWREVSARTLEQIEQVLGMDVAGRTLDQGVPGQGAGRPA